MFDHLHTAIERAIKVGVIKSCKPMKERSVDYDDLDSEETLDTMAEEARTPYAEKLREVYVIEWPDKLAERAPRLKAAREKHIAKAEKRAANRKRKGASDDSAR